MPQQISKKITTYLFIFFMLVTINNTNLPNDFYKIKYLNIEGLNITETNELYSDLSIFKNENIFSFDKKNISKKIYSNKFVEKFEIFKIYPSTLNIEIKKTKFLAITKKNNNDYLIGNNGKLINTNNKIFNLPYIFGNIDIENFLNFKNIIDESKFQFNKIEKLYYFKSNRWDIKIEDGLVLKFPSDLTISKLNKIFEIIQTKNFDTNQILDFRQSNMMVIDG